MIFRVTKKAEVISRLLLFCVCLSLAPGIAAQPLSLAEGVFTLEQAKSGEALYSEHCAHCHDHEFYKNSLRSWRGMTVLDYWYRILGNMPADKPKSLNNDQYLDIVAWILALNGFPAGAVELTQGNSLGRLKLEGFE